MWAKIDEKEKKKLIGRIVGNKVEVENEGEKKEEEEKRRQLIREMAKEKREARIRYMNKNLTEAGLSKLMAEMKKK